MPLLPEFDESMYLYDTRNSSGLYVKKFGYEIEGSFNSQFGSQSDFDCECSEDDIENGNCDCNSPYDNQYFKEDGSVHCNNTYAGSNRLIEGEIASCVFRIDRLEQFRIFAKQNMPEYVDRTAGIHVSISTNNTLAYEKLMDNKFFKLFRKSVKVFMNSLVIDMNTRTNEFLFSSKTRKLFNDRFNGVYDTYCKNSFAPDSQVNSRWNTIMPNHYGRYNCMSYPHGDNGRLECRMFPSTSDHTELILMVEWFVNFTNEFLKNSTSNERAISNAIEIDESHTEQNTEVLLCV